MATGNKVTMAVLDTKLDLLTVAVKELKGEFTIHVQEDRQMRLDVDRLNQIEGRRIWHLRTIWTALIASAAGWFWKGL